MTIPFGVIQSGRAPAPSCAYPLDATESELLNVGSDGKLTMSNSEQTWTYTYRTGLESKETYRAATDGFSGGNGNNFDTTSGIKAMEFVIDSLPPLSTGSLDPAARLEADLFFITPSLATQTEVFIASYEPDTSEGTYTIEDSSGTRHYDSTTPPSRIGVYFNAATGGVGLIIDETDYGETTTYDNTTVTNFVAEVAESSGIDASLQGETVQLTLISDASNMQFSYPSGATDVCGNAI